MKKYICLVIGNIMATFFIICRKILLKKSLTSSNPHVSIVKILSDRRLMYVDSFEIIVNGN